MRLAVLAPHFAPDTAPTGVVVTRVVEELAARGHRIDVVTSLPWYRDHRIEPDYGGRLVRHEDTPWGRITRVHPFPNEDKRDVLRRAAAFGGFSVLAGLAAARGGRLDGVLALSPPLTLGVAGWGAARRRRAPLVFNVQDVFPDVAVELGVVTSPRLIAAASALERWVYDHADAVTVLSEDLRANVAGKARSPDKVRVIPNFVDVDAVVPAERENAYRREHGLAGKTVVMYAGNVGFSQSLDLVIAAAAALAHEEDLVFVVNGGGAARADLERAAAGLPNVRFVEPQPAERLPEVLAAADVHLVPLKAGLARSSVPSKTYSILAAGRPLLASVDVGSEVARVVEESGAGVAVPPDDPEAFTKAVRRLVESPAEAAAMGEAGRRWVERWASPARVAEAYEELFAELVVRRDRDPRPRVLDHAGDLAPRVDAGDQRTGRGEDRVRLRRHAR
ncbi:MAG TPA: glycosyltransferase family 4 protein, partial [Actinomycetota bacterium]|nr:glycosyltransferase family 4 protein [Actinomycetota bacterium]